MSRKHRMLGLSAGELNLTAMIDVAFQLLAFFIITVHPVDVFSNLDVFRPSQSEDVASLPMIRVGIYDSGYTLNDEPAAFERVEALMTKMARTSKDQSVLLVCSQKSQHAQLVHVLDLFAKLGMTRLSVVSTE